MSIKHELKRFRNRIYLCSILVCHPKKEKFTCPICDYSGPFLNVHPPTGLRRHAKCPRCGALERHRIQYLVLRNLLSNINTKDLRMLHFAPEPFFTEFFSRQFGQYETADLHMRDVDYQVDMQELPLEDQSFDFVFASHVLEHIPNDIKAASEVRRILRPGGMAVLPVPLVSEKTIEYPAPNPHEAFHVRAPGLDYFDRFQPIFSRVELFRSDSLPAIHQLHRYEDRSQWPTKQCPLRLPMPGDKHIDIVPVCYA